MLVYWTKQLCFVYTNLCSLVQALLFLGCAFCLLAPQFSHLQIGATHRLWPLFIPHLTFFLWLTKVHWDKIFCVYEV